MASANGKFILGGEHSVVLKGRALGFPVKNFSLSVSESQTFDGLRVNGEARSVSEFQKILEIRHLVGASTRVRGVAIESAIPLGAGLGSSAALCTALARQHHPSDDPAALAERALRAEKLFHGSPSGIDPYTIAFGRPLVYRAADRDWRALELAKFHDARLRFVLVDSELRHRTSEVIEAVTRVKQETPLAWEDLIDALASNAEAMVEALEQNPAKALGPIMNDSHSRLIQLGVSNERMDALVERLRHRGALGAKLTGSGRGGFVLALVPEGLDCDIMREMDAFVPEFS